MFKGVENIISIFPTIIYNNKLKREFTEDELKCVLEYYNKSNVESNNILSIDMNVLDNKGLSDIKLFCQDILDDFFLKIYNPINPNSWLFTQSNSSFVKSLPNSKVIKAVAKILSVSNFICLFLIY